MLTLNAIICLAIVIRLFMFRRNAAKYKVYYSFIAWGLICASGAVAILTLFNQPFHAQAAQVVINLLFFVCMLKTKGNVSQTIYVLFDTHKHSKHHKKGVNQWIK
ncbi:phage holin family protein [Utexia brackfieldae]|uniref:phage holin family protein n=1 Tax=Utexia brackfieldae TaxID=3074108 RepID=UPI00370D0631